MPTATRQTLSGPTVRKTMDSIRRASHDDGVTNERSSFVTPKNIQHNSSYNEERSVNKPTSPSCTHGDDPGDLTEEEDSSVGKSTASISWEKSANVSVHKFTTSCAHEDDDGNLTEEEDSRARESTPNPSWQEPAKMKRSEKTPTKQVSKSPQVIFQQYRSSVEKDTEHGHMRAVSTRQRNTPLKQVTMPEVPYAPECLPKAADRENGNKYVACAFVIGLTLSVVFLCRMNYRPSEVKSKTCEKFYSLEESYKNIDDSLWDSLLVTFKRAHAVQKRREPGTFLFLHNGSTKMVDRFIGQVTNITAECFGGTQPIVLGSHYFKRAEIEQDFGEFLSQQTDALRKQGIMVVRNLEDVPPNAAQGFHCICDPDEPLVDRAVIYFTMDTSKISGNVIQNGQSATADAERLLNQMWKHVLKPEVLDPLITRLTENVYRIV